ncbi:MAG: exodeoxyribonuclease VII large subunit [Bacteroidales bacterium]|nr:exodeoxyribonuclease VII large subunit [Bacteroidales bacterium]
MKDALSLYELNSLVKVALKECFPDKYWVRAELSEVRTTGVGHCYVEFVEKESRNGNIVAKMRGNIWATTFKLLRPYFEEETGQPFGSGLKVLVQVSIDFHELYGPSLTVTDIDPTFTIGDMLRQRLEIIKRLKEEGIFDQNKQHSFPILPQRLAIISSATAAGYDDLTNQLRTNSGKYAFSMTLFPALMQGEQAESTILKALNAIDKRKEEFDVVVIIRGGGAVSDLSCFDSYALAKRCATFSLPIITGIGHERDESILDLVAHTRMKTPTAAAEHLISCLENLENYLFEIQYKIIEKTKWMIENEKNRAASLTYQLSNRTNILLNNESNRIINTSHLLKNEIRNTITSQNIKLKEWQFILKSAFKQNIQNEKGKLAFFEQTILLSSPETMLKKGFSLTLKNGKVVRSATELQTGEKITTFFADGEKESIIS